MSLEFAAIEKLRKKKSEGIKSLKTKFQEFDFPPVRLEVYESHLGEWWNDPAPNLVKGFSVFFTEVEDDHFSCKVLLQPGAMANIHYHPDMNEHITIVQGSLVVLVKDEKLGRLIEKTLHTGDELFIPAGQVHGGFFVLNGGTELFTKHTKVKKK